MSTFNVFSCVKAITETGEDVRQHDQFDEQYIPFVVGRALSFSADTVIQANEVNRYGITKDMHFVYLRQSIKKKRRFLPWKKSSRDTEHLQLVKKYYKYSDAKAREALPLLTSEQLQFIQEYLNEGETQYGTR